ncbi:MAG: S-layer homology domain-containing protein, partial [Acidimicrobiaceae bacterium]|nr:S-layer homology domain-containing protein [Acidimicrobiaceae bacterium]
QVCQPPGQPAGFTDVTPGDTHSDCIEAIYAAGITKGCGTSPLRYCGGSAITRAEMASFLARALKLQPPTQPAGFTDVDPASTHGTNIEAIYAAGITKGCNSNPLRYCGDDSITRAEMASFLARALKLQPPAQPAGFLNLDPDGLHSSAIEAIYAAGITKGCNTSPLRYCGDDPVTRAEMASFIARAFKL